MKATKRHLTLIELVVAIAIIAVMATLVGGAFEGFGRGSGVETGISLLGNTLGQAQSHAASRRRDVAVIFLQDTQSFTFLSRTVRERPYGAFRLAYVESASGGGFNFIGWLPNAEWRVLPATTVLLSINNNDVASTGPAYPGTEEVSGAYVVKDDVTHQLGNLRCLVFSPRGTLKEAGPKYLVVADCYRESDGALIKKDATSLVFDKGADNAVNGMKISINPYTGVIKYGAL